MASKPAVRSAIQAFATRPSCTRIPSSAARHQASVPGLDRQVIVRHLGSLAPARIDDDQRALRVLLDVAEYDAGAGKAVRLPGVLADEDRDLAMLEIAVHAGAEHLALHPEFPGFLLRQRIGAELVTDRLQETVGVGAAEVVALSAAAVIENALAAVRWP